MDNITNPNKEIYEFDKYQLKFIFAIHNKELFPFTLNKILNLFT